MANLNLDKAQLVNLEYALYREVLRTNRAGSYSSTTIIGCNTRKFHGALVCPVEAFGGNRYVLLSSVDISIVQQNQVFNLGIRKYQGSHYEPKGHKYLTDFELHKTPRWVYQIGGMTIKVEHLLVETEEQVLVKVTIDKALPGTTIRLKPFLAFRGIHELTQQNMVANTRFESAGNGIKIKMYEGFPYLHMQVNTPASFIAAPDWYKGVEYLKEQQRGLPYQEDLFVPGYFELECHHGEEIIFSAATKEADSEKLKAKFATEQGKRIPRDTLLHNLLNSAGQFIQRQGNEIKLLAGYHWYNERLRDTLVALPGLMAFQENKEPFLEILDQAIQDIRKVYLSGDESSRCPVKIGIDVPLWLFFTVQEIAKLFPEIKAPERYGEVLTEIVLYFSKLSNGPVRIDETGLIHAREKGVPLTWMDAVVDGEPVTWRPGYVVEINALWYNALAYYHEVLILRKGGTRIPGAEDLLQKVKDSFPLIFWNERGGYLYDYVDGETKDDSIRPNQVIAVSLTYSPLDIERKKMVIDVLKKELLTPRGLRSLSPSAKDYVGAIEGDKKQRDLALHQGSVFPWLAAFFAEGYLSIHKKGGLSFIKKMIEGFEEEMSQHCLGTIPECFSGNPPHVGKGAVSMAWNVASVLRIIKLIDKYS